MNFSLVNTLLKNVVNINVKLPLSWNKNDKSGIFSQFHYSVGEFCDKFKNKDFGNKIAFVYGTSRHETDCLHPGFVSDALYVPEIIEGLRNLYKNKNLIFKSFLDIDVSDKIRKDWNIITIGDGEVNNISCKMLGLCKYETFLEYPDPESPIYDKKGGNILEISEKEARMKYNNIGAIIIGKNPWNKFKEQERFMIYLAGIGPIGTVTSLNYFSKVIAELESRDYTKNFCEMVVAGIKKEYEKKSMNYKNLCPNCCILKNENNYYYEGELSNVKRVTIINGIDKEGKISERK